MEKADFAQRMAKLPHQLELPNLAYLAEKQEKFHLICMDKPYGTMKNKEVVVKQDVVQSHSIFFFLFTYHVQ